MEPSTETYYWGSRIIAAMADANYAETAQLIERYQEAVAIRGRQIIREYDQKICETGEDSLMAEANEKLAKMAREETLRALEKVLHERSLHMKNGFHLADH